MVEAALVDSLRQDHSAVRFDWGMAAATYVAGPARGRETSSDALPYKGRRAERIAIVVVDTLSFTTAVSVATGRGMAVLPCALADRGAALDLANKHDAQLAVRRREMSGTHPWSLSPAALLTAPVVPRLVLPSPNGSAVLAALHDGALRAATAEGAPETTLCAGCLRNAAATAEWLLAQRFGSPEAPVIVIAAGEQWPDGSLRPALEDVVGAGAVIERLRAAGCELSVESRFAASAFAQATTFVALLADSASGRELAEMGFPSEVEIAGELDADAHASTMADGMLVAT